MTIAIINGPNLNLLGTREPEIYGSTGFDTYLKELQAAFPAETLSYFQSNVEGEIIDALHRARTQAGAVILNAAGYTHTSVAIGDAVKAIGIPVVEVHISNVFAREEFRHRSFIAPHAIGVICGLGLSGYNLAIQFLSDKFGK